jgi:hypothetical protein
MAGKGRMTNRPVGCGNPEPKHRPSPEAPYFIAAQSPGCPYEITTGQVSEP